MLTELPNLLGKSHKRGENSVKTTSSSSPSSQMLSELLPWRGVCPTKMKPCDGTVLLQLFRSPSSLLLSLLFFYFFLNCSVYIDTSEIFFLYSFPVYEFKKNVDR